jgi:hypothetical protein
MVAQMTTALDVVRAWQRASRAGDLDTALALSASDIEVGGPRGSGRGHQLVRDWFGRTGIDLVQLRAFHRANVVVIEHRATWRLPEGGISTRVIGTVFEVAGSRVAKVGVENASRAIAGETFCFPA